MQAHEFRSIPKNNFYKQRMFRLKEKLPVTDASRTFGRPFTKEKEEGPDHICSTDSGKIATGADEKPRPRAALGKGDSRWDGGGGGEGEREDARPLTLAEETGTGRGNRSQSFDSSPSSHDKSRKMMSSERKRAASLNSHSPSDTSRPINFLISPEGSPSVTVADCNNMPPLPQTQRETSKDGSMNSLAVVAGNAGINTSDYFMKAERFRQTSVDSSSWSPNISSRAGSIDQESGKESQKSIESGAGVLTLHQDQELCVSSAAGFTSEERDIERERGARSISIGSYSRSPATRSPSPPSVLARAGRNISTSPKLNTPPIPLPLPLSLLQGTDAASASAALLFSSPTKLKLPRSPRRSSVPLLLRLSYLQSQLATVN